MCAYLKMKPEEVEEMVREMQEAVGQGVSRDVLLQKFKKLSKESPALFEKASKPMTPADLHHMEVMLRNWRDMIANDRDRGRHHREHPRGVLSRRQARHIRG